MKTYERCRSGSWGLQGQVRQGRAEPWELPRAFREEELPLFFLTWVLFFPLLIFKHAP